MFGKKNYTVEPTAADSDVLIQLSEPAKITRKTRVSIPIQYKAIALVDQKPLFRIEPCVDKLFVKAYGKEYIGKQLRIAFIATRTLTQSPWGFGNIQVKNERLRETYRIGANGRFSVEIADYAKMLWSFPNAKNITIAQVREKTISTIKTVGTPILGEYFSKTETSIFEMNSMLGDFRNKLMTALQNERVFYDMGIRVSSLTVDGFHVNEEDLELIRNRINA